MKGNIHFLSSQRGSFNTVRMLLAMKVMLFHALWHLDVINMERIDYLFSIKATPVFFMISGFLIWGSIGRSKDFATYFKKRFWRIFPELWLGVVVGLIVLLLLFDGPMDWLQVIGFAFAQGTFLQFWTPDCLRGYGCGTPNGSLWTIGILIQFYFLAYFLYKVLHGQKMWKWLMAFFITFVIGLLIPILRNVLPVLPGKILGQMIISYLWCFVLSSFVAEKKEYILPYLKRYWWVLFALFLMVLQSGCDIRASYYILQTTILFLSFTGFAYAFPKIDIKTDISYGIYIYHMIVVNAVLTLGYKGSPWLLFVVVLLTGLMAYLSTVTVGKFSKRMVDYRK